MTTCPKCEALQHTLDLTLKALERASVGWIKEIECHRNTTHRLVKLQNPHASPMEAHQSKEIVR